MGGGRSDGLLGGELVVVSELLEVTGLAVGLASLGGVGHRRAPLRRIARVRLRKHLVDSVSSKSW